LPHLDITPIIFYHSKLRGELQKEFLSILSQELRKTGLEIIGDVPWGTHFCQFYQTKQDLLDILVPYFSEGLKNNEFCMWVTSKPLGVEAARKAMAAALSDFEKYVRRGQIEILPHTDWYLKGGIFDSQRVLKDWVKKLDKALDSGYEGLRLTGNTFWLEHKDWAAFTDYEAAVDEVIGLYRMLAICTYSLQRCGTNEILDIVRNHRFALIHRQGRWDLVESTERKRAQDELRRLAHFPEENPNPVLRVTPEGIVMYANTPAQALLKSMGWKKKTPIPQPLWAIAEKAKKRRGVIEAELTDSLGKTHWLAAVRPAREAYINLYARDITKQWRAEEALRKAKSDLEIKVKKRTAELQQINERLKEENQERVRTEQSLRLEEARLDALLRLSQMSKVPLNEITSFTLEQAIALTRSKIGFVGFLNEDESIYTLHAVSKDVVKECNVTGDPVQWHVVDAGIWADAIREHKTLFVNDYSKPHPKKKGLPPGHPYMERFMIVPILESDRIIAVAGVGNKASDYNKSDERQIVLLMNEMWSCVQKNLSREELEKAYNALEEKVKQRTAELAASTAALEESRNDLNHAQEVGQIGSWRLDVRRNVLTWSDENYRIFGVPLRTPLTYQTFLSMVHPDDRQYVDTKWNASLRGEPYDIEHRIVASGEVKWVREKAYLELDESGEVQGGFGITQDITERKQAEADLHESAQRLKRAQEIAHLGSWELDLVNNVLTWSDEVYRIFGLQPQEFGATYEAFLEAIHPEDRSAVDEAYSGSLREGRDSYEIEHRIVRRDNGEIRVVHEKCEHVRDASGRIIRSIGMVHDITESKKTEALRQALSEQERLRLGAAVEQASDAVVMVDLEGTIQYVNAAFETINRMRRDKAVGRSYSDFLAKDKSAAAAISESIAQGRTWRGQLIRPISGGRPVELEVTISPAQDPSGTLIGGLITEKDVTLANALRRQVRQAQKMEALGTLAGGIAHDFNNILSTITINSELALLDLDLSNPARDHLPIVLQAVNRGKELVKQIIAFTRQREGKRSSLDVVTIVKEAMKFLRSTLPKDIEIHEAIDAKSGIILADPSQIHQILVNLCQNAALAMRDCGGKMEVKLEPVQVDPTMAGRHPDLKPGPYVRLTVADTGCGMSGELIERIFEPFFTTREPGKGSGLGLAVVHGIVKGYNGAITVYSEPDKGSVFNVYIPRQVRHAPAEESFEPLQIQKGREHILFVEDEVTQLKSMSHLLERLGYQVTAKASGRAALAAFKESPDTFDLVITDQTMPQMSGITLAKSLVKIRPDIPIILCTGFSEKVNGATVGRDGIRAFVMKPFSLQEISTHIRTALKK
jgi:PAS domain S-box-containing protein